MENMLLDFFENNVNYKKLKKSRLKRNIALNEVAIRTGIPYSTLKHYEDGDTKKIPFEAVKKICEVYGTDYNAYYAWTAFPLFGSLSGILISLFFGISVPIAYTGSVLGSILGVLGMLGGKKLFESYSIKKENIKKIIYNSLISPHPRAKKCTIEAAKVVLEAAVKAGAPEGLFGWIDVPSNRERESLSTRDILQ